jgi:pimeloyl-ACP methyl ester carboxylesterase
MHRAFCVVLLTTLFPVPATAQARPDVRVFDSHGVPIRYLDLGSGEPVLLIHGFGGRLELWEATGVIAGLTAAGFRIVAYDARGHGGSGKPHDPQRYGQEDVEDAIRLLDHLSIQRAHVVGYSRGSNISSKLLAQHPNRVRSVVFGGWGVANSVDTLSLADCLVAADSLERGAFPHALARALRPSDAPLPPPEQEAAATQRFVAVNDIKALAAAFRSGCGTRGVTVDALRASRVPALAIVGARDGMAQSVDAMAREMEGDLEVAVIADADHFTTPGHPEFLARLVRFLKGRGHAPP